jgi:hypothetical protein
VPLHLRRFVRLGRRRLSPRRRLQLRQRSLLLLLPPLLLSPLRLPPRLPPLLLSPPRLPLLLLFPPRLPLQLLSPPRLLPPSDQKQRCGVSLSPQCMVKRRRLCYLTTGVLRTDI